MCPVMRERLTELPSEAVSTCLGRLVDGLAFHVLDFLAVLPASKHYMLTHVAIHLLVQWLLLVQWHP